MITEIPQYGLKAYALFFGKHGTKEEFSQRELDFIVGESMKKKIFALLLRSGWIKKKSRETYLCNPPENIMHGLLEFKVPEIIKKAKKQYAITGLSAIEIWSDYSYVQRGIEKSPYFINVLKKDVRYWKEFFNKNSIPNYMNSGTTIGEYIILIPTDKIQAEKKDGLMVERLEKTLKIAESNEIYAYACNYMREKYGLAADKRKRNL